MKVHFVILMMILSATLTGCVETIVMDPGEEDLPVMVNCVLEAGFGKQTLYLQYVKGKSRSEYIPIENATVRIEASEGLIRQIEFKYVGDSKYEAGPEVQINKYSRSPLLIGQRVTYTLSVEIPGRETITARTTVPANQSPRYYHDVVFEDIWDFYFTCGLPIDHESQDRPDEPAIHTSPVWIFASKWKHVANESARNRYPYLVTDHPFADDFNNTGLEFSDLVIEGDPDPNEIRPPLKYTWPAFKGMRHRMPDLPLHDGFVRIDHLDNKPFHLLAGPLSYMESYQDHFDFFFVSEEYDKYLRSVYILNTQLDNNFTSVFSTDNAYTNIEGGVGIFGAVFRDSRIFLENY